MNFPGKTVLSKIKKHINESLESRGVILMYHRVADVTSDPWQLSVSPKNFAEQMEVLQRYGSVMKLQDLAKKQSNGKQLKKAIAVTFDDGYADNYIHAKPIMEKFGVPATIFVSSSFLNKDTEYWWDDLDRILLQPGTLPDQLEITVKGNPYNWSLGDSVEYSYDESIQHKKWLTWEAAPTKRHHLYNEIWHLLSKEPDNERRRVLNEMAKWAGLSTTGRAENKPLTTEQAQKLVKEGLIDIGGHTVSHPMLSSKPLDVQKQEILQGKIFLEELINKEVATFSYPFGNYKPDTVPLVKEAGFVGACTTESDFVRKGTSIFEMPRFEVIDWNGEEFERKLHKWLYKLK